MNNNIEAWMPGRRQLSSDSARVSPQCSRAQLLPTAREARQARRHLVRRGLWDTVLVMERPENSLSKPAHIVARIPADELVAVACKEADL